MDGLSRLVRMARFEGELDVRCLIAGRFALENSVSGPGKVPFHLLLDGYCTLTTAGDHGRDATGDLILLPQR